MDATQVASQLIGFLGNNQDLISQFVAHPYSTTAQATGTTEEISKTDMSQILTQVASQAAGSTASASETSGLAEGLLGQSGGSIHSLASALFGGASATQAATTDAQAAQTTSASSATSSAASSIADMFTSFMNHEPAKTPQEVLARSAAGAVSSRALAALVTGTLGLGKTNQQ